MAPHSHHHWFCVWQEGPDTKSWLEKRGLSECAHARASKPLATIVPPHSAPTPHSTTLLCSDPHGDFLPLPTTQPRGRLHQAQGRPRHPRRGDRRRPEGDGPRGRPAPQGGQPHRAVDRRQGGQSARHRGAPRRGARRHWRLRRAGHAVVAREALALRAPLPLYQAQGASRRRRRAATPLLTLTRHISPRRPRPTPHMPRMHPPLHHPPPPHPALRRHRWTSTSSPRCRTMT